MASTYSPLLKIQLIGTGEQSGVWGATTNTNLGTLIEQAIAGVVEFSVTAGNVTLTTLDGTADQARCMALRVTGSAGVSRNVVAPTSSKLYVVFNDSDADVVLKATASTGLTIPSGETYLAFYDSSVGVADFRFVGHSFTNINTAKTLVLRDASGAFSAGIITAALVGNVLGTLTGNVVGNVTGNVSGNAGTVTTNANLTGGVTSVGNAATVITNANLTGVITSSGNTTSIASQTGTGSQFVVANAPTITNPTVTSYIESVVAIGTVTSSSTISLTSGTVQTATLTSATPCTFTMPTATAGKSFILLLKQPAAGSATTATFTGVKWGNAGAPVITATVGKMDILSFITDGTNWYGSTAAGYTP